MNALRTAADYELFVYTLGEQFPAVRHSTLRFIRLGATLARVATSTITSGSWCASASSNALEREGHAEILYRTSAVSYVNRLPKYASA
jgi:hypothetical protein